MKGGPSKFCQILSEGEEEEKEKKQKVKIKGKKKNENQRKFQEKKVKKKGEPAEESSVITFNLCQRLAQVKTEALATKMIKRKKKERKEYLFPFLLLLP